MLVIRSQFPFSVSPFYLQSSVKTLALSITLTQIRLPLSAYSLITIFPALQIIRVLLATSITTPLQRIYSFPRIISQLSLGTIYTTILNYYLLILYINTTSLVINKPSRIPATQRSTYSRIVINSTLIFSTNSLLIVLKHLHPKLTSALIYITQFRKIGIKKGGLSIYP